MGTYQKVLVVPDPQVTLAVRALLWFLAVPFHPVVRQVLEVQLVPVVPTLLADPRVHSVQADPVLRFLPVRLSHHGFLVGFMSYL